MAEVRVNFYDQTLIGRGAGPDQFAAWLGADLELQPRQNTSWCKPFVQDWADHPELRIDSDNRWWRLYLQLLRESVRAGEDKWVTGFPDLHTGIDALSAIRGPENLAVDLVTDPDAIHRAMRQTSDLWKCVVDTASEIILPAGQGTSNWTMGWSDDRFLCIGQNDFSCMISPATFRKYFKPGYAKMYALCKQYNALATQHSDGYTVDLWDEFLEAGLTAFNMQTNCVGVETIEKRLKGRMCLIADIDRQTVMPFGTPQQVRAHVEEIIKHLGSPTGGLILRIDIYPDVPLANIEACMAAVREFGNYWCQRR